MENNINIAELLKDCPKGMELDCTILEGLEFDDIVDNEYLPIRCRVKNPDGYGYNVYNFTKYGCWVNMTFAKCVIFPKGKTTWEGFQSPFKDGDVVVAEDGELLQLFLLKHLTRSEEDNDYDGYCYFGWDFSRNELFEKGNWGFNRLATEEEKQKLFDVIKANGYKWNAETKTLEKLIEPKFNVGDRIKHKENTRWVCTIARVEDRYYVDGHPMCYTLPFGKQNDYELVPNKFDITTLKPFDKVLVRNTNKEYWMISMFGYISNYDKQYFMCIANSGFYQCIPYEHNEHLCGTTNDCDEFYKTW